MIRLVRGADPLVLKTGMTLILATFMTEAHAIVRGFWPELALRKMDLFISSNFRMEIEFQWYIKFLCDDFYKVIIFFLWSKTAYQYSIALYFLVLVYMGYHIADAMLFMWNYKQDPIIYKILVYVSVIGTFFLIVPHREKMHSV